MRRLLLTLCLLVVLCGSSRANEGVMFPDYSPPPPPPVTEPEPDPFSAVVFQLFLALI
jgi:hypothetical protein